MQHTGHNYYFDRKYQISWSTAKKVLPLYQQFPPRLFTMRTRAELFLYTYGNDSFGCYFAIRNRIANRLRG